MTSLATVRDRSAVRADLGRFGWILGRFAVTPIALGIAAVISWQLWIY